MENADPSHKIKILEKKLALARQSLVDYRTLITEKYNVSEFVEDINEPISHPSRDDDRHYFQSYGEHGQFIILLLRLLSVTLSFSRYPRSHDPG